MSEVKWVKLNTDMFDDEKIRLISAMPESDAILIIWIRLITLAGRCNFGGYIFFTETMPYTEEMLATIFNKPVSIIRLALKTFLDFKMIENDEKGIYLINWEKHQNVDGLEKIREQNRQRKQKQREREKQLLLGCHMTSRDSHATDKEKKEDKEIYIEQDKEYQIKGKMNEIIDNLKDKFSF